MNGLLERYSIIEECDPIDAVGGLRYNSVKWDVNITASVPILPAASRRFAQTEDRVDPYVGVRLRQRLGGRWTFVGYADIGGLGIGSDLSWQAIIGADYAFSPHMIGKLGYRHTYTDYHNDGFTYDIASSGIYAGLGIRW